MKEHLLREFIAMVLLEASDEKLLGEPDFIEDPEDEELYAPCPDNEQYEVSMIGGGGSVIQGVTTPLGTGPTYPGPPKKKRLKRKKNS